jgi:hypothetical protein
MQMVMPYLAFLAIMAFKVHNCFILRSIYLPPQEKLDLLDGIKGVTGKMQVHRTFFKLSHNLIRLDLVFISGNTVHNNS